MVLNQLYFYNATIVTWKSLLKPDKYKLIVLDSLRNLVFRKKIKVYGFVIMPNHVHLIWELLELNGKEKPNASFMKYTSHMIQQHLSENDPDLLDTYKVNASTRDYQFWQRDSLPIVLYSPKVIYQKLNYIHNNPVQGKWTLAESPICYKFSSARFYEDGSSDFGLLTHIGERL